MSLEKFLIKQLEVKGASQPNHFGVRTQNVKGENGRVLTVLSIDESTVDMASVADAASLAAFYNAKFFHETLDAGGQLAEFMPRHAASFSPHDGVVAVAIDDVSVRGERMLQLTLDELCQVSERLAQLHSAHLLPRDAAEDIRRTIDENYDVVQEFIMAEAENTVRGGVVEIEKNLASYFSNPQAVREKLMTVIARPPSPESLPSDAAVLCHGALAYDRCTFDRSGQLVGIDGWMSVHTGHPAEDIASLIISSAEPSVRRKEYMKIIRHYFYTLVDNHRPPVQLPEMRAAFKRAHREVVLRRLGPLLDELRCPALGDDAKQILAKRWESALDDAVIFAEGDDASGDEQCFFK